MAQRKLILALLASGIFYILGYLPILPAGDYRYFIWTIMSSWVAVGLIMSEEGVKRRIHFGKQPLYVRK